MVTSNQANARHKVNSTERLLSNDSGKQGKVTPLDKDQKFRKISNKITANNQIKISQLENTAPASRLEEIDHKLEQMRLSPSKRPDS